MEKLFFWEGSNTRIEDRQDSGIHVNEHVYIYIYIYTLIWVGIIRGVTLEQWRVWGSLEETTLAVYHSYAVFAKVPATVHKKYCRPGPGHMKD